MSTFDFDVRDAQIRLACKFKLSPQLSLMLALLVKFHAVTPNTILQYMGNVAQHDLVKRLRRKLEQDDANAVRVNTIFGIGYCLDDNVRASLAELARSQAAIHEQSRTIGSDQ